MDLLKHAASCLSFDRDKSRAACREWAPLPEQAQRALLELADRAGLSLYLWRAAQAAGVADTLIHATEYRERRRKNEIRLAVRRRMARELEAIFAGAGLRFAMLKGFFLAPDFVPDAADRLQNDIDFIFSAADAQTAFEVLLRQGYTASADEADGPAVHLPMLLPPDFIHPQGDGFDPATQAAVELHHYLWRSEFECIPISFDPDPLSRLGCRDGLPVLHPHDQLSSVALHAMRHVFRGSLRISHLYELAGFLETHACETAFWRGWINEVNEPLRRLTTVGLALAARLFHSPWPAELTNERQALPASARQWIERYGEVVLEVPRRDKLEVFLQLAFVPGWRERLLVLRRRLAPTQMPGRYGFQPLPFPQNLIRRGRLIGQRLFFHFVAFFKFLRTAVELWL